MDATETAAILGISISTLTHMVYARRLRPEQLVPGAGPRRWTFSVTEVEWFRRERNAGIEAKRRWNGSRPRFAEDSA